MRTDIITNGKSYCWDTSQAFLNKSRLLSAFGLGVIEAILKPKLTPVTSYSVGRIWWQYFLIDSKSQPYDFLCFWFNSLIIPFKFLIIGLLFEPPFIRATWEVCWTRITSSPVFSSSNFVPNSISESCFYKWLNANERITSNAFFSSEIFWISGKLWTIINSFCPITFLKERRNSHSREFKLEITMITTLLKWMLKKLTNCSLIVCSRVSNQSTDCRPYQFSLL